MAPERPYRGFYGNASYNAAQKKLTLGGILEEMDRQGKLGSVIIDAGSGPLHQAPEYPGQPPQERRGVYYPTRGKKIVRVDADAPDALQVEEGMLTVRASVDEWQPETGSGRKLMAGIRQYLKIPKADRSREIADAVLFSDSLNYMDFKRALANADGHLRPNGRIIIHNSAGKTLSKSLLHEKGPQAYHDVTNWLLRKGYEVEHVQHAWSVRPFGYQDQSLLAHDPVIIVARKTPKPD